MLLVAHLHFLPTHNPTLKNAKELPTNAPRHDKQKRNEQTEKRH